MNGQRIVLLLASGVWVLGLAGARVEAATAGAEPNRPARAPAAARLTREGLRQAVDKAKKNDRSDISKMVESLGDSQKWAVSDDLVSDFTSFLKHEDAQVQLLGAHGLLVLRKPESKNALVDYLVARDFGKLRERIQSGQLDRKQAQWQVYASLLAIRTLGKVGDKSVVPLLKSLRGQEALQVEWGGREAEEALAELGEVETLSDVSPQDDEHKRWAAADAIRKIRDPKKTPDLIATVRNKRVAREVRATSAEALSEIGAENASDVLFAVVDDPNEPNDLRKPIAVYIGKMKAPGVEQRLLTYAENRQSLVRAHAIVGLVFQRPEKYLDLWFTKIMDVNEPVAFRETLAGIEWYMPPDTLKDRKSDLYRCLDATYPDGRPADRLRVQMWELIHDLFRVEPHIVLSSASSDGAMRLKGLIRSILLRQRQPGGEAFEKIVNERFDSIVTIQVNQSQVGK